MNDPRIRQLAELLVNRSLDVQPGWQVVIRTTPLARPLLTEVAKAVARREAYALVRMTWNERSRVDLDWAREAPLELLAKLPAIEAYSVEHEDARLTILAPEDLHAGADLEPERRRLMQRSQERSAERGRTLDVRWAVTQFPTEASAQEAGMTLAQFEDYVYGACLRDWDAEHERMRRYAERFDGANEVRIVGRETDLTLSIEGREATIDHGLRNMPAGEFFFGPVEDSAEGVVTFAEFPSIYQGRDVAGARLVFEGGAIVDASAEEGDDALLAALDTDEGARRLGELGIGCNPGITKHMRNTLFDEKIDGTIHLAVGASYTFTGATNKSAIHWDLVKDLRSGGELWCDGELVQRDGRWLI
ncbi:MAG: aminopeptidase [Gaiellaceae bacterium MAG52_C11]|nr:aminopeptidase [Candidatus Gaiellasilicea maunaloa]